MTLRATPTRLSRLVRGWSLASIATFAGVISHVLAMGHVPPPALVAVCWALSGLVCVLVSGIRWSVFSTALSVICSQGILHWLFAQTGHGVVMTQANGEPMVGHAAHMSHGSGSLTASVSGQSTDLSIGMVMMHLAAALLTYLAIRRGDAALAALSLAVRIGFERVSPLLPKPVAVVPAFRPLPVAGMVRVLVNKAYPGPVALRGPPVPFVSA